MFMKAKEFPDVAFYPIPKSRLTYLFLCHDPQAVKGILIFLYKNDKITRGPPPP
jgi:hypothetical protein